MRSTIGILTASLVLVWAAASSAQPPAVPTKTDTAVATEIEHRLSADRDVNAQSIKIDVRGGVVTLSGHTPDDEAKTRAGKLAAGVPGVVDVENDITIGNPAQRADDVPGAILEQTPGAK